MGSQSFHVNIRHRVTGRLKVLGHRVAEEPSASLHRAVAHSLVDSYVHGNADPIRRYLEDIGVAASAESDAGHFFRRPAAVAAAPVSTTRAVAEALEAQPPVARTPVARAPLPAAEPPPRLPRPGKRSSALRPADDPLGLANAGSHREPAVWQSCPHQVRRSSLRAEVRGAGSGCAVGCPSALC